MTKGWTQESTRHALASKGIKTGRKKKKVKVIGSNLQPFALKHRNVKEGTGETYQYDVLGQFYSDVRGGEEQGELYQEKYKGRKADIVWMSPAEYWKRTGLKETDRPKGVIPLLSEKHIQKYMKAMKRGDKFAMPWLDYREGKYSGFEGKHRIASAERLGIKKIPVVVVKTDPKKYADMEGWIRGKYEMK